MGYEIKVASINDMPWILKMAQTEGWLPGIYDAEVFFQADPQGFYVGFLNDQPISCISTVKYHYFSFIGLYIVDKNYRGLGFGYHIWQYAINKVKHFNLGLDGVIDQQENYKKSGFKLAYRNIRFQGKINKKQLNETEKSKIFNANAISFDQLLNYDNQFFLEKRENALASWLMHGTKKALIYIEDNQIKGFGAIRECVDSVYKIGPLFADNEHIAETLFFALANEFSNFSIILDTPEPNKQALALVEKLNFTANFETARMYSDKIPMVDLSKIYGVSSFELG